MATSLNALSLPLLLFHYEGGGCFTQPSPQGAEYRAGWRRNGLVGRTSWESQRRGWPAPAKQCMPMGRANREGTAAQ